MKAFASPLLLLALLAACGSPRQSDRIEDEQASSGTDTPDIFTPEAPEAEAEAANESPPPPSVAGAESTPEPGTEANGAIGGAVGGRTVSCRVRSGDWVLVDGPCRFLPDRGGSFTLDRGPDAPLKDDIISVSVTIVEPGRAEVRGLTDQGINARWGEAHRWSKDPACWVGSDFEVCAR